METVGAQRMLTEDEQALLGSLLEASEKVRCVSEALARLGVDWHRFELVGLAERIGADACRLAGVTLDSGLEGAGYGLMQALSLPVRGVPLLLWCPQCNQRHIDVGEWATRLHHTHACQVCGNVWRPALVETVGVQFLPGFKSPMEEPDGLPAL